MKKILITGGAGFLGSYLSERLLERGFSVTAIDTADGSKIAHLMERGGFRFVHGSILDTDLMEPLIDDTEMIFHFAAIADPMRYVQEPLTVLETNLQATLNILRLASRNRTKVIFASSSEIFGKNPNVPWREEDDRVLGSAHINRWCYSSAKSLVEHYLHAYHQQKDLPFVIVRFFNAYGPGLDDLGAGRVIPVVLRNFLSDETVYVHGDGKQTRAFTYIDDVVDAILRVSFSENAENQAFNIGAKKETSILELVQLIKKVGNFTSPIEFISYKDVFGTKYEDIPRRVPDVSKIQKLVGWKATTSLKEGLKKTIDYYRNIISPDRENDIPLAKMKPLIEKGRFKKDQPVSERVRSL